jgi:hypothetical protein
MYFVILKSGVFLTFCLALVYSCHSHLEQLLSDVDCLTRVVLASVDMFSGEHFTVRRFRRRIS